MKLSLSLKLLTTLAVLTTMSSQAMAQDSRRDRRQAEKQANRIEQRAANQNAQNTRQAHKDIRQAQRAQQSAIELNRRNAAEAARQQDRARELAQRNQTRVLQDARRDYRRDSRFDNRPTASRWDNNNRWDDRNRWRANRQIVSYNKAFRNWDAQRDYLKANIRRLKQANALSALQQQQLNAQMQAAYLAYHNNNWNGGYNWDYYSEPQFLDYLQLNQPSLLDRILGYLGIGSGLGLSNNNYLYSDNWDVERDQLARNMSRIHQLALEGRITPYQEQQLLAQLQAEYSGYRSNYHGSYGWNTYADPGFLNYLNTSRPSLLTTIRSYLR